MKRFRVGPITVAAVGTALTFGVVSALVFLLITPAKKRCDAAQKQLLAASSGAAPGALARATQDLADAKARVERVKFQWAVAQAKLMPPYDVSNRVQAMDQLTYELTQNLGPDLEYHLRRYHGRMTAQFSIPPPPATPNSLTAAPVAVPLGVVTSRGSLPSVLNQFRDWRSFNRVVLLDNLALHGNSPYIQATYNATVFLLPQNGDKLPPAIPQANVAPSGSGPAGGGPVSPTAPTGDSG